MQRSVPAQISPVLQTGIVRPVYTVGRRHVGETTVDVVIFMPGISRVGNCTEARLWGNSAVEVAAQVANRGVSKISGIDTLWQQSEGVEEIQILSVVVEPKNRLHFPATNAEPGLEPIVGKRPIKRGVPFSQVAEVSVVNLRPDSKLVSNLDRDVPPKVGKSTAALAGMHGQPVVLIRVYEALRRESVKLNRAVKQLEFLRLQGNLAGKEKHRGQSEESSKHAVPPGRAPTLASAS